MWWVAVVLLGLLTLRAFHTFDPYYDSVAYHLPFAARLAGICDENCFQMSEYLEAAYDGFPKLIHLLQGLVWRITGRAQSVDLVNLAAIGAFCVFLRQGFGVPAVWTFCALIAVPLVQIHATSAYVDLPVNCAAAMAIMSVFACARDPQRFGWPALAVLFASLAVAANGKPQMIGVVVPIAGVFAVLAFYLLATGRAVGPFAPRRAAGWLGLSVVLMVAALVSAATLIGNALEYGNPVYPIRISFFGVTFDGPIDGTHIGSDSLHDAWQPVPSPLRWVASVLEFGAHSYRAVPWTYDQGYCPDMLAWRDCGGPAGYGFGTVVESFRMGGYFVGYVLALLVFLGWSIAAQPQRLRRLYVSAFAGTTLLAALLPRSHELRYYMFWMLVLVGLCLAAAFDREPAHEGNRIRPDPVPLLGGIVLVALSAVLLMTQARYVWPAGDTLESVIDTLRIRPVVERFPERAVVCAGDADWAPFTFLFAQPFHAGRVYSLRDRSLEPACSAALPPKED
jgi:uncharacterized membrane protein (GlpM family)